MSRPCLLFDLDGTLTDADHLHHAAFNAVLGQYGRDSIDSTFYKTKVMGFANAIIFGTLFPGESEAMHRDFALEKEARFRALAQVMHPLPGLLDLLARAKAAGVPCAVVTNAPRANVTHQLAALGLEGRFEAVVVGEELPHSKPHPLPYLTALERLGGNTATSLGFEDSLSGLRAGLAAGLVMAGLATSLSEARLVEEGAALAVARYDDPRLAALISARLGIDLGTRA